MGSRKPRAASEALVVVDSDVLIWYLRGAVPAHTVLGEISYSRRLVSSIVVMELLRGCRDRRELRLVRQLIEGSFARVVHVSEEISRRATALVDRYALSHRMWPDDALVAATALTLKASILTGNVRDFRFVAGLSLVPFRIRR